MSVSGSFNNDNAASGVWDTESWCDRIEPLQPCFVVQVSDCNFNTHGCYQMAARCISLAYYICMCHRCLANDVGNTGVEMQGHMPMELACEHCGLIAVFRQLHVVIPKQWVQKRLGQVALLGERLHRYNHIFRHRGCGRHDEHGHERTQTQHAQAQRMFGYNTTANNKHYILHNNVSTTPWLWMCWMCSYSLTCILYGKARVIQQPADPRSIAFQIPMHSAPSQVAVMEPQGAQRVFSDMAPRLLS